MSSVRATENWTRGAWSLADQVTELRGKHHLKEKTLDAYKESSKSEIKKNEQVIHKLRHKTKHRHILVANHENGDNRVIKMVFKDDRKELLSLQRLTAQGATYEMDQTVCQTALVLNALRFEREKSEQRLLDVAVELETIQHLDQSLAGQVELDVEVIRLENSLDAAQMKAKTAVRITRCYRDIVDKFREERMMFPAKLEAMEAAIEHQRRDLVELRAASLTTMAVRDEAKQQLMQAESQVYHSKRQRDAELAATRKEVESCKNDGVKAERRVVRDTTLVDTPEQKAAEVTRDQDQDEEILRYEESFNRIMEAANVTSIGDALERVARHRETYDQLKLQLGEQETQREALEDAVSALTAQYHDMRYTGEQKLSRGQRCLEDLEKKLGEVNRPWELVTEATRRGQDTLLLIKAGVATLMEKLQPIKLRAPEHSFTKGDVFEQLQLCRKKLEHLVIELAHNHSEIPSFHDNFNDPQFMAFLESCVSADNVRIQIETTEDTLDYDHRDTDEVQEVLTRAEIKELGQKLISSKEKSNKKKVKKAK